MANTNTNTNFFVGITESTTVEFKTSLFIQPGATLPGEDQIRTIIRTIGSFMNAQGGTLYMGVNDSGVASDSITGEMRYLNSFPPYPNFSYPTNKDGYKRFILDWAGKLLGNFATILISFDFVNYGFVQVCKVNITKSKVPVWFDGNGLYVRTDASTRQLRGNDITNFIAQVDKADLAAAQLADQAAFQADLKKIKSKGPPKDHILVVYPNGDYVYEKNNVETMLEVIRRAGLQNVMNLGLVGRVGRGNTPYVPFIGKSEYFDNVQTQSKTQSELNGYYVFKKYGTGEIMSKLTDISNGLGLGLYIERY